MRPRLRAAIADASNADPPPGSALRELLEALEDEPKGNAIREDLTMTAAVAAELAREDTGAMQSEKAAGWARVAAHALEALRYAPEPEDSREALSPQDRATLERADEILEQLNMAGDFLRQMGGEFRSAQSPVADRWASRIEATMEELTYYRPPAGEGA